MNDWLDVMLGEIDRKKQESEESLEEAERRRAERAAPAEKPSEGDDGTRPVGRAQSR